ncbi:hypothetical protein A5656_16615 [Mycobacterium gordonae]|nr:hypothetical protein [Mycobacterium gordonae]OBK58296.1 hypothetical protein A5656_16615 [Mycobacterium gordonae]
MTQPTNPSDPNASDDAQGVDATDTHPAADDREAPEADSPESSPNSEAARYRRQLRDVQAERDALTDRVRAYQRRECESMVSDLLDVPADLFDIGQIDITAFYDEDGTLNEGELRAAAGALLEERPRLGKPQPTGPRWQNFGQYAPPPPARGAGWSDVLKG